MTRRIEDEPGLADRFWAQVEKADGDGCWLWTGHVMWKGYGQISVGGRAGRDYRAHRLAWELTNGPIPDGLQVLHVCDRPICVRPSHLFLGTGADNMADKVAKGRQSRGSAHSVSKLNEAAVVDIRRRYMAKEADQPTLAREYGVSVTTIAQVISGKVWGHVPTEGWSPREEVGPRSKLTPELAAEIRARYAAGGVRQKDLAAEYGVSRTTICHTLKGDVWRTS